MHKHNKPLKNEETTMVGPHKSGLFGHLGPYGVFVKNTFLFHSQGIRMDFINIYSIYI